MTLLEITTFINTRIRNLVALIDKVDVADVNQAIVNELYQNEIIENTTTGIVFNKNKAISDNIAYEIKIKKIGKTVFLNGYITVNNPNQTSGIIEINNPDFAPVLSSINDLSAIIFTNDTVLGYAFGFDHNDSNNQPQIKVFRINQLPFQQSQVVRIFGFYTTQN